MANAVFIIGRCTKDVECRYAAQSQTAIAKFSVAVDDGYGEKKKTNFIPVTVFGKQAENCEKFIGKGSLVGVQGRLQSGSYTDKNGSTVYTLEVIADRVEFLSWRNEQSTASDPAPTPESQYSMEGFSALDDSVPF